MYIPNNLQLKESPIHGLGIFVIKDIKKGQYLGEYIGVIISFKEFKERYNKDTRYTYRLGRLNQYIVSKDDKNWINYINENRLEPNVCCKKRGCVALKDISIGTELCLDYGNNYPRDY
jgi:SET domain-containing protein